MPDQNLLLPADFSSINGGLSPKKRVFQLRVQLNMNQEFPEQSADSSTIEARLVEQKVKLQKALALHQQGQLEPAEALYKEILLTQPKDFDALRLLGVIALQRGQYLQAVELISAALAINPDDAYTLSNLGNALLNAHRPDEALAGYERALALDPDIAEVYYNRGNALRALKRPQDAVLSYDRALALKPDYAEALNNRGNALLDLQQFESALTSFNAALALKPDYVNALMNRGNALQALNRFEEALAGYDRALGLNPELAQLHYNRGNAWLNLQKPEDALLCYRQALKLKPDYAEACKSCGNTLFGLQRFAEALTHYEHLLSLMPDDAEVFYSYGNALLHLKRSEEALGSFERALALKPDHVNTLINRGIALLNLQRFDAALNNYDRLLGIKPDVPEAYLNRGNALLALRQPDAALSCYDKALALRVGYPEALTNRGLALLDLKRPEQALALFDRMLTLKPDDADVINNRGNALFELNRFAAALACYEQALSLKPDFVEALANIEKVLYLMHRPGDAVKSLMKLIKIAPDYAYVQGRLFHLRLHCCDWTHYQQNQENIIQAVMAGKRVDVPFSFYSVVSSAEAQLQCARTYIADQYSRISALPKASLSDAHAKIRVAYVSADFREHPVSYLIAGLFEMHTQERFEFIAISLRPEDKSPTEQRVKAAFKQYIDVSRKSDREIAELIRALKIDIAVDLMGFTAESRPAIFAYRPAPVQVNYLGCPGTIGADFMDYIIADAQVIPLAHQDFFTEKVVYMPDTYMVNDSKRLIAEHTPSRIEAGLPETGFVFCCFNNNYKITPHVFDIWMRLLHKIPGSVLWLSSGSTEAVSNLKSEAESRGIEPDRLIFASKIKPDEHLARHRLADLFLDTLPYNAHTTACDALWTGLPVLTCLGDSFAGRVAGSLLTAVGLPELITDNYADYEALAFKLATTPSLLAGFKIKLSVNRTSYPLFDTDRFRRHIEFAYLTMWERYRQGEAPESFVVSNSFPV